MQEGITAVNPKVSISAVVASIEDALDELAKRLEPVLLPLNAESGSDKPVKKDSVVFERLVKLRIRINELNEGVQL